MFFQYGSYVHTTDEVALVDVSIVPTYNRRGFRTSLQHTWQLRGVLIPSSADPTVITSEIAAIKNAYAVDGRDAGLFEDDGTQTTHFLDSSASIGGVRVIKRPSFPNGVGASYVTHLRYTITLQAEFADVVGNLEFYQEQLSFGGTTGPVRQWVTPITGPPQRQMITQRSTQRIVQSGTAIGFLSRPNPQVPRWPSLEHVERRQVTSITPTIDGGSATSFGVSWSYEFESINDLSGLAPATV